MEGLGYIEVGRMEDPPRSRGAISTTLNVVYGKCFLTGRVDKLSEWFGYGLELFFSGLGVGGDKIN